MGRSVKIYLDSCIIIYLIEGSIDLRKSVIKTFMELGDQEHEFFTSSLSKLECLVKPKKEKNIKLIKEYKHFFSQEFNSIQAISDKIIEKATDFRVKYSIKTPDAIHFSTAIQCDADYFITGDVIFKRCNELKVIIID